MTDPKILLERHKPRLVYDSMEAYFADSAAIWTDFKFTRLNRAGGAVVVPQLSLAFLGATKYADGKPVNANDTIGETTRDYKKHAADAHANVRYRNRVHGRAKRDDRGRLWLQYWCFYYYNKFQVFGPFSAGNHEGDWEMVQILLDGNEQPTQAVYAQHSTAEAKPWSAVGKAPSSAATPLVYVARGSHAAYFTPGQHTTGFALDNADGKGPQIDPAVVVLGDNEPGWAVWPGRWGDTKSAGSPLDSASPPGPGGHGEWRNPATLAGVAARAAAAAKPAPPTSPPPPSIDVRRDGDRAVVEFHAPPGAAGLVVAVRPEGSDEPARTVTVPVDGRAGEVEIPLPGDGPYELHASVAAEDGTASTSTSAVLR